MSELLTFVVLTLVAARVTRFIFKDTMWKPTRDKLIGWLEDPVKIRYGGSPSVEYTHRGRFQMFWRKKLAELIECPYCVSIWVAAGTVFVHRVVVEPLPQPVWYWLAVAMGAVVVLEYTDGD